MQGLAARLGTPLVAVLAMAVVTSSAVRPQPAAAADSHSIAYSYDEAGRLGASRQGEYTARGDAARAALPA